MPGNECLVSEASADGCLDARQQPECAVMTMDLRLKSGDAMPSDAPGAAAQPGSLTGIRVIELADEQAEYCGLTLAGLGADVLKVEPPGGRSEEHTSEL